MDVTEKLPGAQRLRLVEAGRTESAVPRSVGSYTLYEEIAFGGMGAVHLSMLQGAAGFRRPVAIKRLHARVGQLPASDDLRREALLGARVRHPNVVPVLDLVESNNELFLVMEFVLGETMARLIRKQGMLPVAIAAAILSDVLQGLHAAHIATGVNGRTLGIVHRDVSPQNILVGVDGVGRILDFGVAKCLTPEEKASDTTEVGFVKGKLGYIAPEQLLSEPLDARTDVFAAGVVLWEALTGRRLFKGLDAVQALVRLADQSVPPPSTYNREVTPSLDALVARALHRSPQSRFQTAEEFAEQLQTVVGREPAGRVGRYVETAAVAAIDQQRYLLRCIQAPKLVVPSRDAVISQTSFEEATTSIAIESGLESPQSLPHRRHWYEDKLKVAVVAGLLSLAGAVYGFSSREPSGKGREPPVLRAPGQKLHVAGKRAAPPTPARMSVVASAPVVGDEAPPSSAIRSRLTPAPAPSARGNAKRLERAKRPVLRRALAVPPCHPPYRVDSRGIKRIKRECL